METTNARRPKMLPWLAKKAGITEHRADVLWHAALRHAARVAKADTSDYWKAAMDRLLELIAAEALREDAASFGLRNWARLQARAFETPLALFEAASLNVTRGWRLFSQSTRFIAL